MTPTQELVLLRTEASGLRKSIASTWNAWQKQRQKNITLEEKVKQLEQEKKAWKKEKQHLTETIKELEDNITSLTEIKDTYQGMIFKAAVQSNPLVVGGKKRGGQSGHAGTSRRRPMAIDCEKGVYLTHCPDCTSPVPQTHTVYERIVIDIPIPKAVVTRYSIQRQWCKACGKEVCGVPTGTLPGLRFGTHFLSWLLLHKYRMRTPLAKITELAFTTYQLDITEGGLQKLLSTLKTQLGSQYAEILKEIRQSKVKHADETTWRVAGKNHWCWLFATKQATYYTIEETRGKGVPQKILSGSPPESVLVRDDYGAYTKLPVQQQSCWSHLLRVSHDVAVLPTVSKEMAKLHTELSQLFIELKEVTTQSFDKKHREVLYAQYTKKLEHIESRNYTHRDSKKVQTRIQNQHTNLLTAILYKDVPLTNNHAERQIRPMAVSRKISGGSQSQEGAAIHAVLMSVVQTLSLRGQNILNTLPQLLSLPTQSYTVDLGKGE